MNKIIPLFPLNIVVFPGEKLDLHIFEPRYKQLILDCKKNNTTFGMPFFNKDVVSGIGTELKLLRIEKTHATGEMDIKTIGCGVFKVKMNYQRLPGKLYALAAIEMLPNEPEEDPMVKAELYEQLQNFYKALQIQSLFIAPPINFKAFDIAHSIGLSVQQEYGLLGLSKESERQEYLLNHLKKAVPVVSELEKMKEKIRLN